MQTAITQLFGIQYPVVQAGMIWCSGWRLASAVSNAGGLGLLGAGSMYPDVFLQHVKKMHQATNKPWGVNLPLLYPQMDEIIEIVLREKVGIVFTSAGNPKKYTGLLKENGIKVAHVIANAKFAEKAQEAGVDTIVAEGFEAGGHNGIEETTTMNLIPLIRQTTRLPIIAAGGIGTGSQMLAAIALGADGVQIGSRFAASVESSAHDIFKQKIIAAKDGDTVLTLKSIVPVRLIKNAFYFKVKELESKGASTDELKQLLGRGRAKLGMFEGNEEEGELEIGQVAALINDIKPAAEILEEIINDFNAGLKQLRSIAGDDQ
jgi:enoyl-[acyl-carrier protein] reductase II